MDIFDIKMLSTIEIKNLIAQLEKEIEFRDDLGKEIDKRVREEEGKVQEQRRYVEEDQDDPVVGI